MKFFLVSWISVLIAFASSSEVAAERYKEDFKSYIAALDAGDQVSAAEYAESAWRAAEVELGDHETTAILAFNYAELVYFSTPELAREPLERVIALTGESNEIFGREAPIILLRFVELMASDKSKSSQRTFRGYLTDWEKSGKPNSLAAGRSWFELCKLAVARENFGLARDGCQSAYESYEAVGETQSREFTNLLIVNGVVRISGKGRRSAEDVSAALAFLATAVNKFPPQQSIDDFDPMLGLAYTWFLAAESVMKSDYPDGKAYGSIGSRRPEKTPTLPEKMPEISFVGTAREEANCDLDWNKQKQAEFPNRELNKGYLGAVLLGYNIDDKGKVIDARVISEVPQSSSFGEAALDALKTWSLTDDDQSTPYCRQNLLLDYRFVIRSTFDLRTR